MDVMLRNRLMSAALLPVMFLLTQCATQDPITYGGEPQYQPPSVPRATQLAVPSSPPLPTRAPLKEESFVATASKLLLLGAVVVGVEMLFDRDDDDDHCGLSKRERKILEKKGRLKKDDPCPAEFLRP